MKFPWNYKDCATFDHNSMQLQGLWHNNINLNLLLVVVVGCVRTSTGNNQ